MKDGVRKPHATQAITDRARSSSTISTLVAKARYRGYSVAKLIFRRWLKNSSPVVEQSKNLAGGIVVKLISRCMKP
jgi:hypothetical protein